MSAPHASAADLELLASRICFDWHAVENERRRDAWGERATMTAPTRAEVSPAVPVQPLLQHGAVMDKGRYRAADDSPTSQPFVNAVLALKASRWGERRLAMGYALSGGVWRPHAWLQLERGIYDPTGHHEGYWGFILPQDQTQQLAEHTF